MKSLLIIAGLFAASSASADMFVYHPGSETTGNLIDASVVSADIQTDVVEIEIRKPNGWGYEGDSYLYFKGEHYNVGLKLVDLIGSDKVLQVSVKANKIDQIHIRKRP